MDGERNMSLVCLALLTVAVGAPTCGWAASRASAEDAVATALPDLATGTAAALVELLVTLEDGSSVSILVDGQTVQFDAVDGAIAVDAPAAAVGVTLGEYRSAVAFRIKEKVDLAPLHRELERKGRDVRMVPDAGLLVEFPTTGDVCLMTNDTTVAVLSPSPLDSLLIADQLAAEAEEMLGHLRAVNALLTDQQVASGMRDHIHYSAPAGTYKSVRILSGVEKAWGYSTMPKDFDAAIRIPDIPIAAARLRVWSISLGPQAEQLGSVRNVTNVLIDGTVVIGEDPKKAFAFADLTEKLQFGDHRLSVAVSLLRPWCPLEFGIDLVVEEADQGDFQIVVAGKTATSVSSQAMDKIAEHWPGLAGLLSEL